MTKPVDGETEYTGLSGRYGKGEKTFFTMKRAAIGIGIILAIIIVASLVF
jgi:hypothetical protein